MYRKYIALFFTFIFMAMISAPSIIAAIDDSIDISIFFTLAEEEEEKDGKENKDIEVLISELRNSNSDNKISDAEKGLGYFFKKYSKPHLNLVSPPPEFYIL